MSDGVMDGGVVMNGLMEWWSGGVFAFLYRPISGPIYYWRSAAEFSIWRKDFEIPTAFEHE